MTGRADLQTLPFDPLSDICEDLVILVVVEEEVVAFGVEFSLHAGFWRELCGEAFDIRGVGKDVLAAVEDEGGNGDLGRLGGELIDHALEVAEESQGELGDVPGVVVDLIIMDDVASDLHLIDTGQGFERDPVSGMEGGGDAEKEAAEGGDLIAGGGDG